MAVRALSPQYVICDEIGSVEETNAVVQSLNAGVSVIASIHAGSAGEILRRKQAAAMLETGAFGCVALLCGSDKPGEVNKIYRTGDLLAESDRSINADCHGLSRGVYGIA